MTYLLDAAWASKDEAIGMTFDFRRDGLTQAEGGDLHRGSGGSGKDEWAVAHLRSSSEHLTRKMDKGRETDLAVSGTVAQRHID